LSLNCGLCGADHRRTGYHVPEHVYKENGSGVLGRVPQTRDVAGSKSCFQASKARKKISSRPAGNSGGEDGNQKDHIISTKNFLGVTAD
jgi:hypothetical protein